MIKVGVYTLGCKVNQAESEEIKTLLDEKNFQIVEPYQVADVYIINTCSVTHIADSKSRQAIRKVKKINKDAKIIVTGCYANYGKEMLSRISEIDFIFQNEDKFKIPDILYDRFTPEFKIKPYTPSKTRIFIKIQDGCNHFCSYCIVPYIRSKIYSLPVEKILEKVRAQPKICEIVLCGIRLGLYRDYSNGESTTLIDLLRILEKEENILRIRLSSIEPQDVSDELINIMSCSEKICPHLHIPLQSGDDKILKKMKRAYTTSDYYKLVEKLKKKVKNISITTDVIVGFPYETEKHFEVGLEFIKKIDFLKMHVFKYSKRKGTEAEKFQNLCSEKEKQKRSKILLKLSKEKEIFSKKNYLGKILNVLVEKKEKDSIYSGYSENYIKVYLNGSKDMIGKIVKVKIADIKGNIVYGITY